MRYKSLPGFLVVCAIAFGSLPLHAVDCSVDPPPGDCTLLEIYSSNYGRAFPPSVTPDDVTKAVTNANVATTTPDTFAGVVHSTYQDFLNLFSFAINKVDESKDGQALIVRFNPLREGRNLLGFSLTVSKPVISDLVGNAIPEADRAAALTKLEDRVGDLDDITYAAAYSAESTTCAWEQPESRCWGRSPATYRPMLAQVLAVAAKESDIVIEPEDILRLVSLVGFTGPGSVARMKLSDVDPNKQTDVLTFLRKLAATSIQSTLATKARFEKSGIDKLASLIDNQPQLAATGTYRDPGTYGGPPEAGLSFELQFGRDNLNALRRQCSKSTDCVVQALRSLAESGLSTDKFVLTATYKRRDPYTLATLGLQPPVTGFTPIDVKRSSELHAKLQWGRLLDNQIGTRNLRFDLSAEGMEMRDDKIRTKNRWVATATLTVPLGDQMSIPVSINYANKPEFLTGQRQQLGAHLGLTYRLPWEKTTP